MWEPFGPPSANATATWVSGRNSRGTLNILSTCLITLVLCVYTCLHVDIPEHGKTHWKYVLRRKLLWVLPGLFAPEVIAFIALRQRYLARELEVRMKSALDYLVERSPNSSDNIEITDGSSRRRRLHPWTRLHSQYALMGGFAFDTSRNATPFFPESRTRLSITSHALQKLATYEPDLIPDISAEQILEKSKAHGFAKVIVYIQASWFIIQTVGRLIAGYPISLLELNPMLHAFCCLVAYMAWWNKPLDIQTPTLIDVSKPEEQVLVAWMVMKSVIGYLRQSQYQEPLDPRYTTPRNSVYYLVYEDDMKLRSPRVFTREEMWDYNLRMIFNGDWNPETDAIELQPSTPVAVSRLAQSGPFETSPS